jgi:hypothetical protein
MDFVENSDDGDNTIVGGAPLSTSSSASSSASASTPEATVRLVDVEVTSEIVALNLLVSFLNLAQRRGVFSIDESAKIWECVKKFQR